MVLWLLSHIIYMYKYLNVLWLLGLLAFCLLKLWSCVLSYGSVFLWFCDLIVCSLWSYDLVFIGRCNCDTLFLWSFGRMALWSSGDVVCNLSSEAMWSSVGGLGFGLWSKKKCRPTARHIDSRRHTQNALFIMWIITCSSLTRVTQTASFVKDYVITLMTPITL